MDNETTPQNYIRTFESNPSESVESNLSEKNISFLVFYSILFVIIFICDLVYFNSPKRRVDNYIETANYKVENSVSSSGYEVVARTSEGKILRVKLEHNSGNSSDNSGDIPAHNLIVDFIFDLDKLEIKIWKIRDKTNEDEDLNVLTDNYKANSANSANSELNYFDPLIVSDSTSASKITFLENSNIGVRVFNCPFNFVIFRKDTNSASNPEVVLDSRLTDKKSKLLFSEKSKNLSLKIAKGTFHFGLSEDASPSLRLAKKKYSDSAHKLFPFVLCLPPSRNPYGLAIKRVESLSIKEESVALSIERGAESVHFFIFTGKSPKEVIEGMQKAFSLPLRPGFSALDWQSTDGRGEVVDLSGNKLGLDIDLGYTNNTNNTNYTNSQIFNKFHSTFTLHTDSADFLPFNNNSKAYSDMFDYIKRENKNALIFSQVTGVNNQMGKYLHPVDCSYEGMKTVIRDTMKFNIFGNPHVIHQIPFLPGEMNTSLASEWISVVALFPHSRIIPTNIINNIMNNTEQLKFDLNNIFHFMRVKLSLSVYFYSYFVKMASEGGSLVRPLFLDFNFKLRNEEAEDSTYPPLFISAEYSQLMEKDDQFMLGSNIMAVLKEASPRVYFPNIVFYDLYTGEVVNKLSAGFYDLSAGQGTHVSLFLRGGLITPLQDLEHVMSKRQFKEEYAVISNSDYFTSLPTTEKIKKLPVSLVVSLDSNLRATGRILLDEGINTNYSEPHVKKGFYKMEVSASPVNNNFVVAFHVNSFKFKLREDDFPFIDAVVVYGYTRLSVKKVTVTNKDTRVELVKGQHFKFEESREVLRIGGLNIRMDCDSKLVIS